MPILKYPANVVHWALDTKVKAVAVPDWVIPKSRLPIGTIGKVFEPAGHDGQPTGPMVRFENGTCCNVYEGWVEEVT